MRRLFWDAEVSPNVLLSWRIGRKITLTYDNILTERQMISIAWKWEGQKSVHALHWDSKQNDKAMLREFNDILNSSDEAIAHFGDSFDLPWFRARCLINGIQTNHLIKTVDTCKMARKLYFNSAKLDYLGKILGVGQKLETEFGLWRKVLLDKNSTALNEMVRYNKEDVRLLERVYHKLASISAAKSHAGVMAGHAQWSCPVCATEETGTSKTTVSARGLKQYQMKCRAGHYYTISEKVHEEYKEK